MDGIKEGNNCAGLEQLEKTFRDYKTKLENADVEAREIINQAWQKADIIIKEQRGKAQRIADELTQAAKNETTRLITEARERAEETTKEANRILTEARLKADEVEKEADARAKKEAKDRCKRECEKLLSETRQKAEKEAAEITSRAKRDAEEIIREMKESEKARSAEESSEIISAVEQKARRIREDSVVRINDTGRLVDEVSREAVDLLGQFQARLQSEFSELILKMDNSKDNLDMRSILGVNAVDIEEEKNGSENKKKKIKFIVLPPYTGVEIRKLLGLLKEIPGVRIDSNVATEDDYSISLISNEPIPLKSILSELTLIESSDVKGDTVKLRLKPVNIGFSNTDIA